MTSHDPVGYTFDADTYCVDCTERAYPGSTDWRRDGFDPADYTDSEGNELHAIFGWTVHQGDSPDYCGSCGVILAPYECSICGDEHGESAHGEPLVMRDTGQRTITESVDVHLSDAESLGWVDQGIADRFNALQNEWNASTPDQRDEYAPEYLDDIDAILTDAGYLPVTDADQGTWAVYAPTVSDVESAVGTG